MSDWHLIVAYCAWKRLLPCRTSHVQLHCFRASCVARHVCARCLRHVPVASPSWLVPHLIISKWRRYHVITLQNVPCTVCLEFQFWFRSLWHLVGIKKCGLLVGSYVVLRLVCEDFECLICKYSNCFCVCLFQLLNHMSEIDQPWVSFLFFFLQF